MNWQCDKCKKLKPWSIKQENGDYWCKECDPLNGAQRIR